MSLHIYWIFFHNILTIIWLSKIFFFFVLLGSGAVSVAELERHPNTWQNEFTLWESKIACAEGRAIIQPSCYHEFSCSAKWHEFQWKGLIVFLPVVSAVTLKLNNQLKIWWNIAPCSLYLLYPNARFLCTGKNFLTKRKMWICKSESLLRNDKRKLSFRSTPFCFFRKQTHH